MSGWIYFLGEQTGRDLKIGYTAARDPWDRAATVNGEQTDDSRYVMLAALRGTRTQETDLLRRFHAHRRRRGARTEYFAPAPELVEYVNWLRQQWWVTLTRDELLHDEQVEWTATRPGADRRVPPPEHDPGRLIQVNRTFTGDLAGTAWDWLSTPEPLGEDFYTPAELVHAARRAMGGIDLDPASHWRANRVHKIRAYYTLHRSAFANPWYGRVWLNPPYGDNAPWLRRIAEYAGEIDQLCMISPVWVFAAAQARPLMNTAAAAVLLTPTPSFWGQPDGRTGTNHPHLVVYVGGRRDEFVAAFRPYGIPVTLDLNGAT